MSTTTVTTAEVIDLLTKARAILATKFGHGLYYNKFTGCFCSMGAVYEADFPGRITEEAFPLTSFTSIAAEEALAATIQDGDTFVMDPYDMESAFTIVTGYNDSHTQAEVLDVFDRTIARLSEVSE